MINEVGCIRINILIIRTVECEMGVQAREKFPMNLHTLGIDEIIF